MAAHAITIPHLSEGIVAFLGKNNLKFKPGQKAQVGDIVLCSQSANWVDPEDLGKVLAVCPKRKPFTLPDNHPDGKKVELYVLTFTKMRKPRGKLQGNG